MIKIYSPIHEPLLAAFLLQESEPMKDITECTECSQCAKEIPIGFNTEPRLWCTRTNQLVELGDACTMGTPGDIGTASQDIEITIGDRAAVNGYLI